MLKKQITNQFSTVAILIAFFLFVGIGVLQARTNNNDQVSSLSQQNDNVTARVSFSTSTPSSIVLVDITDTTNFKHGRNSGVIEVSQIRLNWTTDGAATSTMKLGVIASTSASGALADIYWFDEVSFASVSASALTGGRQSAILDYQPSAMRLGISSAVPTSFISNDISTSSNQFATTSKYMSPISMGYLYGSNPNVGDLVMRLYDQKGTATTSVDVLYRVTEQ